MFLINDDHLDRTALVCNDGSIITYKQLKRLVNDFGAYLDERSLVFLLGSNNLSSLVCYLSSLDQEVVPLLLSESIKIEQLNNLIDIYSPKYIFQKKSRPSNDLNLLSSFGEYGLFIRDKSKNIKFHPSLALLLTTSGSTGSPKLVRLTKNNIISNAKSISKYLDINSDDRAITSLPYNYSYGLSVINTHLSSGGSIVLTNASMMERNFWSLVEKFSVTSFAGVPYNYEMILRLGVDKLDISSIRKMTQAGGRLDFNKIEKINNSLKSKNIKFYVMYGQTEATARMSYLPPKDIERKPDSIGMAIPYGKLWIVDSKGHIIEQIESVGELMYSGDNVSMGYARSIIDLQLGDKNAGILKTGDLARFDSEGYFFIEGSNNRFVKLFGNRISLDSLEKIVSNKGFESVVTGDDKKIVINIINHPNLSQDSLRSEISEVIGINHVAIKINVISEFPRLDNGKIDYKFLNNSK